MQQGHDEKKTVDKMRHLKKIGLYKSPRFATFHRNMIETSRSGSTSTQNETGNRRERSTRKKDQTARVCCGGFGVIPKILVKFDVFYSLPSLHGDNYTKCIHRQGDDKSRR